MARPKLMDQINVVDLESTCYGKEEREGKFSDVIEIGITPLYVASGKRGTKTSIKVKPDRSTVSAYCTELTGLTQGDVENAISFKDACQMLRDGWNTPNRIWASYGDYDRIKMETDCREKGVKYPFGGQHMNVKGLFAAKRRMPNQCGMAKALEILGWPLEGKHHRGDDDSWNIAKILAWVLWGDEKDVRKIS